MRRNYYLIIATVAVMAVSILGTVKTFRANQVLEDSLFTTKVKAQTGWIEDWWERLDWDIEYKLCFPNYETTDVLINGIVCHRVENGKGQFAHCIQTCR